MGNRYEIMKSMHTIICAMNNEDAYSSWIYIVPDEASDNDLMDIATDDELFADACSAFKSAMQEYGADGFYIDKKFW